MKSLVFLSAALPCVTAKAVWRKKEEKAKCIEDITWSFKRYSDVFPMQVEFPHPGPDAPNALSTFDSANYENWRASSEAVEECVKRGDLFWKGYSSNMTSPPWGVCLPKTCKNVKDATQVANLLLMDFHRRFEDVL